MMEIYILYCKIFFADVHESMLYLWNMNIIFQKRQKHISISLIFPVNLCLFARASPWHSPAVQPIWPVSLPLRKKNTIFINPLIFRQRKPGNISVIIFSQWSSISLFSFTSTLHFKWKVEAYLLLLLGWSWQIGLTKLKTKWWPRIGTRDRQKWHFSKNNNYTRCYLSILLSLSISFY